MSRTYANFLLLEDILDNTEGTSPEFKQALNNLLSPIVRVVEEDCGTLLGKTVPTSFEIEGLIETATGSPLTRSRIEYILAQGQYTVGIRELHSCNSHTKNGICRVCYQGSFIGETAPVVGSLQRVTSSLIYQTDVLTGTGRPNFVIDPNPLHPVYATSFNLSQTRSEYYDIKVIKDGLVVSDSLYQLGETFIRFPGTVPLNDSYVVHFYQENAEPFQGYVSKTYSGGLLGIEPLPTLKPLLRESLYTQLFMPQFIDSLYQEVSLLKAIPRTYLDYVNNTHDPLEKVLTIMYLYAIYSQVQI